MPRKMQAPVKTSYTSKPVDIPHDFLSPEHALPVTVTPIDFTQTPLPEYAGLYAVVLDNVLSAEECSELLRLAEASAPNSDGKSGSWQPALVNVGRGYESAMTDYRNSDRIVWDEKEVVRRLWERIEDGVKQSLDKIEGNPSVQGRWEAERGQKWRFTRMNERMRFLKYGKGQFFRRKCI